jgi:hypothetical protein
MPHDCTGAMWKIRWHRKPDGSIVYQNDYCYPGRNSYAEEIRKAVNSMNRTIFVTKFYEHRTTNQGLRRNSFQRF